MLRASLRENRIRIGGGAEIALVRTLRVPEDGRAYPLPPSLGELPLRRKRAGYIVPLYQREALWIQFRALLGCWTAIQVGAGGVNVLTGQPFQSPLKADPQNYLVCPEQPWLDGILMGTGTVRQFVAAPVDRSIGAQLSGEDKVRDTLQFRVFPSRRKLPRHPPAMALESMPLGVGAGGIIEQKIYPDPFGLKVWDRTEFGQATLRIVNSLEWRALTGEDAPPSPISARDYSDWGLPWFELYDGDAAALAGTGAFQAVKGVTGGDSPVEPRVVKRIIRTGSIRRPAK